VRKSQFLYEQSFRILLECMIAVELCSLTLQRTDESAANLTASALF